MMPPNYRDSVTCPVPDCVRKHSRRHLMCSRHWLDVPRKLRDNVWETFRHNGVLSDEYQQARTAAINSVTPQERVS